LTESEERTGARSRAHEYRVTTADTDVAKETIMSYLEQHLASSRMHALQADADAAARARRMRAARRWARRAERATQRAARASAAVR
jgi:hypothetical protein